MIAANIENLLFLLLVALAGLFQLLAKKASKTSSGQTKRTSTPRMSPQIPRRQRDSDEERVRKLLEALGQPPTSKPPPPVVPRTNIPPRPVAPVRPPIPQPPPAWILPREERRKREIIAKESGRRPTVTGVEQISLSKPTSVHGFEVQQAPPLIEPQPSIKASAKSEETKAQIAALLGSTSGLRDAIILREILGPPRGLRALEFIGT